MTEQQAELAQFRRDAEYYCGHYDDLLTRHPEQWVAIFEEGVVGVAADLDALLMDLNQRGVPVDQALVKHVTAKEDMLILTSR